MIHVPALYFRYFMFFSMVVVGCKKPAGRPLVPLFAEPVTFPVQPGLINEVSGISDSRLNDGYLWAEQDGGNAADLYLIKHDGTFFKNIHLKSAVNRDWEDMCIGPGPEVTTNYIYLADIGDNNSIHTSYDVYRFPEPPGTIDTVSNIDRITFRYADGSHDAEAIFVDKATRHLYIVTKRDASSVIYKLAYPQSTTAINIAMPVDTLPFSGAVGAAVSPDGRELMIKTYTHIYYWSGKTGESLEGMVRKTPLDLPYTIEPQGEAICFKKDGSGFFTLSEKGLAGAVSLFFYKRN